jgi:hypothetical protein
MVRKKYSDNPIATLKEKSPNFLFLYYFSVFIVYFGTILFGWYFVHLAYTVEIPSYDILCLQCKFGYYISTITIFTLWIFNLYFYILNEFRFRFWNYIRETLHTKVVRENYYLSIISVILTFLTFIYFIK